MILKTPGQTYQLGINQFTVGGMVAAPMKTNFEMYGIVKRLYVRSDSCPMALCDFGAFGIQKRVLMGLSPVALEFPVKVGKLYVLHYECDNSDGVTSKTLGISPSKSALLHLMLEDKKEVEEDIGINFHSAVFDETEDTLTFEYQNDEPAAQCYLSYTIAPVPVYCTIEGGTHDA